MVQYTRQLIDEGRFGDLTHYRGRFFSMYGRDRLGLLSWRFKQDEAGYGVLADIMSARHRHGAVPVRSDLTQVVSVKEIFVKERPLPTPGSGTHYDRGKPGDPTGEVTNEDYVGALVEFDNGVRGTLEADRSIFGPQSQMAFELNGSKGAAYWDHEKLNQLSLYLPEEQPTDGFVEVLCRRCLQHHGNFVPGGGNSIGYEDLKTIEALEFLTAVAEGRPNKPDFGDALSVASVAAAMVRSWECGELGRRRQPAYRLTRRKTMLLENTTKRKLRDGETVYGCFMRQAEPTLAEFIAMQGMDFMIFDGEHGVARSSRHRRAQLVPANCTA